MFKTLKENKIKGISSLVFAAFLFSLFGVFTRNISREMGVFYQLVGRTILMSLIFFTIAKITNSLKKVSKKDRKLLVFRGLLVITDFSSFYIAVTNLPLGLTLFVFYAASTISNYTYGYYFLDEQITKIKTVSLVLALIGLTLIYGNSFSDFQLLPLITALISGIGFGLTVSISKKLTDKYSLSQVNLYAYSIAAVLGIPLMFLNGEKFNLNLSGYTWFWLIGFAVMAVVTFYAVLYGYKFIEAQKASLIMLSELVFVIIVGYFIYNEIPAVSTLVGGIIILISLSLPNLKTFKKNELEEL